MGTWDELIKARRECAGLWVATERNPDGGIVGNGAYEARRELAVEAELRRTNLLLEKLIDLTMGM